MNYLLLLTGWVLLAAPVAAAELNAATTLTDQQPAQDMTAPAVTADAGFDKTIDDLPLMPGLATVPDEDMLHLTARAGGRRLQSTAQGTVDIDEVYVFYRQTLPQLGWTRLTARSFARDGETLTIDAHIDGKLTTVRFTIHPR